MGTAAAGNDARPANNESAEANATITSWVDWAKANGNGKMATLGWCFGGGWSLAAALANPLDAALAWARTHTFLAFHLR